tara:strand:- start:12135 stop:13034 length:900 start_codon:yes stop_codon:yes gene_type:complete
MTSTKGYVFAITSLVFMSLAGPLQKLGSANSHPLLVTCCSSSVAFLMTLIVCIFQRKNVFKNFNISVLSLSILYALAMVAFSYSVTLENPFVVSSVARSYIAFSFLLSLFWLKETKAQNRWPSLLVITLGSLVLSFTASTTETIYMSKGIVLAFIYAFLFAIHNSFLKRSSYISIVSLLFWQNLLTTFFIVVSIFIHGQIEGIENTAVVFGGLSGIFSSFWGFLFYHQSIRHLKFSEATAIRAFSPIVALLVIAPFFPPKVTPHLIFGFMLILLGHYFYFKSEVEDANTKNRRILSLFK